MSHPPKDGEVYKTTCTAAGPTAEGQIAALFGDGISISVENMDGYFHQGRVYVWHVSNIAAQPMAGEPEAGA